MPVFYNLGKRNLWRAAGDDRPLEKVDDLWHFCGKSSQAKEFVKEDASMLTMFLLIGIALGGSSATPNAEAKNVPDANGASTTTVKANVSSNEVPAPKPTPATAKTNAVCPDPAKPCQHKDKHFDVWELSFKMPAKLKANKTYSSAPFYALILKTYKSDDDCDGGEYIEAVEAERKQLQRTQRGRKVFASYECPNMGAVDYDFDGRWDAKREYSLIGNFLGIDAGETREDANEMFAKLKGKYPKAVIKQMSATYEWIVE